MTRETKAYVESTADSVVRSGIMQDTSLRCRTVFRSRNAQQGRGNANAGAKTVKMSLNTRFSIDTRAVEGLRIGRADALAG
jgi:hypothetical protein